MSQEINKDPAFGVKFSLSANFFIFFFVWSMVFIYLPKILDLNGFNSKEIGELRAYSYAIGVISPLIYAHLAQKFGRRLLLRIGFFLSVLITLPLFYKLNFWLMAILIMIQYFFMLGTYNQFDTLAINTLENKNDYGIIRALGSFGFVVFAISGGWLADKFGLFNLFWYVVALLIISGAVMIIMPSDKHIVDAEPQNSDDEQTSNNKFTWNLSFILLITYVVFQVMSQGIYNNFFIIYATKNLGYSTTVASLVMSLAVIAEIAGLLISVIVLRLIDIKILLICSGLLSGFRWYVQGYLGDSLTLILVTQLLHMFTFSFMHTSVLKYINDNFKSTKDISTAIGIYGSIGMGLGGVIGSVVAGYTWDLSPQTAYSYSIWFAVIGSLVLVFIKQQDKVAIVEKDDIISHDLEEHLTEKKKKKNQLFDINRYM